MKERVDRERRLEALEEALDDLALESADGVACLVEGDKDEAALRALGLKGPILKVHVGVNLFATVEAVAREHRRVVLLTDWDDRGGRLARRLREACRANGVEIEEAHRRALARATRGELKTVESLATYLGNLRIRAKALPSGDPARARRLAREARDKAADRRAERGGPGN